LYYGQNVAALSFAAFCQYRLERGQKVAMTMNEQDILRYVEQHGGGATARDLAAVGAARYKLSRLVRDGKLERVGYGLYVLPSPEPVHKGRADSLVVSYLLTEAPSNIMDVAVCLSTAAYHHHLRPYPPDGMWLALRQGCDALRRRPVESDLPLNVVRFASEVFDIGLEPFQAHGREFFITGPARTVIDLYRAATDGRFKCRVGIDEADEAMGAYLEREGVVGGETLGEMASAFGSRVQTLIANKIEVAQARIQSGRRMT
jgi:hypothetical protein